MPNHVHLIAVPESEDGLRRAIGEAHRRYTLLINRREGWTGHLWQGRFTSFVMDERYLLACTRYIEMNPVRAGLVKDPTDWAWSSAKAHATGRNDKLVKATPLVEMVGSNWRDFVASGVSGEEAVEIRGHEKTGRPLGSEAFVENLEHMLGRILKPKKAGRKPGKKQK